MSWRHHVVPWQAYRGAGMHQEALAQAHHLLKHPEICKKIPRKVSHPGAGMTKIIYLKIQLEANLKIVVDYHGNLFAEL